MGGDIYYASGGFLDYRDSFDTEDEAKQCMAEFLNHSLQGWAHYVDLETGDICAYGKAYNPMSVLRSKD